MHASQLAVQSFSASTPLDTACKWPAPTCPSKRQFGIHIPRYRACPVGAAPKLAALSLYSLPLRRNQVLLARDLATVGLVSSRFALSKIDDVGSSGARHRTRRTSERQRTAAEFEVAVTGTAAAMQSSLLRKMTVAVACTMHC